MEIQAERALFDLTLLNGEIKTETFVTESVRMLNRGFPPEVVTRLKQLWEVTKIIGGEIVAVGKIIVKKIVDFFMDNPGLAIGLALGGAVAALLSSAIPFIGPLLAPLVVTLGALYGFNCQEGKGKDSLLYSTYILAKKFFELLIDIFDAVKSYVIA